MSGYASSGQKAEAMEVFERMEDKSVLTWTSLISGFVQSGNASDGAEMYVRMRREAVEIDDAFVLSSVISAVADMAALELGRQMHCEVMKLGYESSGIVGNSIVDMYAKCSDVCSARAWFERVTVQRDVVSWTTMIVGEAQHGRAEEALELFDGMVRAGVRPNEVTFVGLLHACSHSGLVRRGREIFDSMVNEYKIRPSLLHYTCLLDLLSRSGLLEEAESVIRVMPCEPDEATWAALLSACKKHGEKELSLRFADHLLSLRPREPSTYILLSNVYAILQKWDSVANVRKLMVDMEIKKEGGYSWIEMGKESFMFWAGVVPHHASAEILGLLRELGMEIRKRGYMPDTSSVMHDLDEQEKVQQLSLHSERLAVAFGLLKSVPGSIIRVVKNLRVCGDCHTVLKLISEIAGREFVVRDAKRFHHFRGGKCSCGDFW